MQNEPSWERVFLFLLGVVKSIISHEAKKHGRKRSISLDVSSVNSIRKEDVRQYQFSPEEREMMDWFFKEVVLQHFEADSQDRKVIEAIFAGCITPRAIADHLGISSSEVYNAKHRIMRKLSKSEVPEIQELLDEWPE